MTRRPPPRQGSTLFEAVWGCTCAEPGQLHQGDQVASSHRAERGKGTAGRPYQDQTRRSPHSSRSAPLIGRTRTDRAADGTLAEEVSAADSRAGRSDGERRRSAHDAICGSSGGGRSSARLLWGHATDSVASAARRNRMGLCRPRALRRRHCSDDAAAGDLDACVAHHLAESDVCVLDSEPLDGRWERGDASAGGRCW